MMTTARKRHIIVFAVNIDSPKRYQVSTGNIIKPVEEPMNLAAQTESVHSTIILQAYQNDMEHGIPIKIAAINGLSFHHSDKYCVLS